jgi:hypothetical protein
LETALMALRELVVPVLSAAGPVGLTYLIMRNFSQVTRALLTVLAAIVAMFARDENRRRCGLDVLGKLTVRDGDSPCLDSGPRDDDSGKGPPSLPKP